MKKVFSMIQIIGRKAGLKIVFFSMLGILLNAFVSTVYGAGGDVIWQYGDAQTSQQEALLSTVDSGGNIIVAGFTLNGSEDFYTAKVKANGTGTLWTKNFDLAGGADRTVAVTVDQNDDVLVTGYAWNGSNYDFHTIKYNGTDGSVIWQNTFNSAAGGADIPTSIAVDSLDNVYVGGYAEGISGSEDFMLIKYSPTGANPDGTPIWQASYNGGANNQDRINAIDAGVDSVAVTGYSHNGTDFDYLTIKYGLDGTQTWLKTHDSTLGDDMAQETVLDSSGNVLVTGFVFNGTSQDIYTIKYQASNGTVIWFKTYDGGYADQGRYIWIDAADDVYLSGSSFTLTGFTDLYTVRYAAADGAIAWEKVYNSSGDNTDIPTGIIVDEAGEVYVAGYTTKASADDDMLVVKYKKDNGNLLWDTSFNGAAGKNDKSVGIGLDAAGHVLIGGWSDMWTSGAADYDFYAIKFDAGLLNPPTTLSAATVSESAVDITWTDNSANEDGFKIWRKIGDLGSWTQIANVGADVTLYNDIGLTAHIWHYYKVQAYNAGDGDSHFTNEDGALTTVVSYSAPTWSYIYNNPDNGDDFAYAIATGSDNHPVVTGSSQTAQNGSSMSQDYHTVKLDRTNASEIWSVGYNDVDDEMDIATSVVVDDNNDIVVSGFSSLYGGGAGNTNDIYTLKYPSTGPPAFGDPHLWDDQYNGPAGDDDRSEAIDAAVDGSNSTVVTGYGKNASANDDIYVVKYLANGTRQWAMTPFNGASNGNDYPAQLVFDTNGDIIVTGKTHNGTDYDIFTRKLSGSDGSTVWTKIFDSSYGWDEGRDVVIDNNDDVYVAGVVVNASGNDDLYLVKYASATGNLVWSKTIDGPANGHDIGESVRVDANNNEVVVGGTVLAGAGNNDFYLARYTEDGTLIWNRQFQRNANDDNAVTMGMDISGNVCLAGNTDNNYSIDLLAIKYDAYGNIIGSTLFNGAADDDDDVFEVAVNNLGEQFISGYTTNSSGNADYLVVMCMGDVLQAPVPLTSAAYYTTVDLAWTDTTSDEDGFYLERKIGTCSLANSWEHIHTAAANSISYSDISLNMSTTYCYRIRAYKISGEVSTWLETEATTTNPAAPSGFTATPMNTTRISLAWTDNTTGEDGFLVERCSGAGCSNYVFLTQTAANATNYNDDSVCESQTYSYRILADKAGDWQSDYSTADTDKTTVSMAAPSDLAAARVSEREISLTWTDNTSDESGFTLQRCDGSGCSDFAFLASVGADVTTYNDTGLDPNTLYRYRIQAFKTADCSWTTSWAAVVGEETTTLQAPSALLAATIYTTQIDLSWSDNSASESGFEVQRCNSATWTCGATPDATFPLAADIISYSDISVAENTDYTYRIMAQRTTTPTWGPVYSNESSAKTDAALAPTVMVATRLSEESVSLGWTDTTADETGFHIERCTGGTCPGSGFVRIVSVGAGVVSYTNSNLPPDTTYWYRVQAYKTAASSWTSGYTNPAAFAATTLNAPDTLTAVTANTTRISLAWDDNTANETGFVIERCEVSGCTFAYLDEVAADTTSYIDDTACNSKAYRYRVKAVDSGPTPWESDYSNTSEDTTNTPVTPTGLTATASSESQIDLTWTDNTTDETGYKVERCETSGPCVYNVIAPSLPVDTDSYSDTGLTQSKSYDYKVTAFKTGVCGWELVVGPVTETTMSPPPPTDTTATVINTSQIDLTWTDNTGSNDGFVIERCAGTDCIGFAEIFTAGGNDTAYSDTSVCPDTEYNYQIKAVNGVIWSTTYDSAVPANITTVSVGVPTGFSATSISETEVDLSWIDNTTDEDGFKIERCNDVSWTCGATPDASYSVLADVTIYSDSGLSPELNYTYRVYPYKAGSCPWVNYNAVDSVFTAIPAPATLDTSSVNTTDIALTWTDTTSSEQGFRIERCNDSSWTCGATPDAFFTVGAGITTYTDTSGVHSTNYTYRVQATSTTPAWSSGWSNDKPVTTLVPAAPVTLIATRVSETAIDLAWTDTNVDETNIRIERFKEPGTDPDDFVEGVQIPGGTTTYQDSGLDFNSTYHYRVRAYKTATNEWYSGYSNSSNAATSVAGPSGLTVTPVNTTQMDLAWTDNTVSETGFEIDRCEGSGCDFSTRTTIPVGVDATTYSDTSVCNATGTYNYRVRAVKGADWNSPYSNSEEDTLPGILAPTGLTVVSTAQDTLELAWTDNSNDETGFKVERCEGAGCSSFSEIVIEAADATSTIDSSGINPSTTYCYRVRATKNSSCPWDSAFTNTACDLTIQAAGTGLTATALNSMKIQLDWTDNSSDEDSYEVYQLIWNGEYVLMDTLPADTVTYTKTFGLDPGKEYFFKVRSVRGADVSAFSNEASAVTPTFVEGDDTCQ